MRGENSDVSDVRAADNVLPQKTPERDLGQAVLDCLGRIYVTLYEAYDIGLRGAI